MVPEGFRRSREAPGSRMFLNIPEGGSFREIRTRRHPGTARDTPTGLEPPQSLRSPGPQDSLLGPPWSSSGTGEVRDASPAPPGGLVPKR